MNNHAPFPPSSNTIPFVLFFPSYVCAHIISYFCRLSPPPLIPPIGRQKYPGITSSDQSFFLLFPLLSLDLNTSVNNVMDPNERNHSLHSSYCSYCVMKGLHPTFQGSLPSLPRFRIKDLISCYGEASRDADFLLLLRSFPTLRDCR